MRICVAIAVACISCSSGNGNSSSPARIVKRQYPGKKVEPSLQLSVPGITFFSVTTARDVTMHDREPPSVFVGVVDAKKLLTGRPLFQEVLRRLKGDAMRLAEAAVFFHGGSNRLVKNTTDLDEADKARAAKLVKPPTINGGVLELWVYSSPGMTKAKLHRMRVTLSDGNVIAQDADKLISD